MVVIYRTQTPLLQTNICFQPEKKEKLMNKLKLTLAALLTTFAFSTTQAQDGTATFSYDDGSTVYSYGTGKKENYDVAIKLDASFAGKTITAITVPLNNDISGLANLKVWLTKELKVVSKKVSPDILSKEGTIAAGTVTVALDEPYTIPSDGLYAGYSIDVTEVNDVSKKPVLVNTRAKEGGFYIHTSRTYLKFQDQSSSYNSVMGVVLSGIEPYALSVAGGDILYGQTGSPIDVDLTLTQGGSTAVQSIDYTYDINGTTGTGHANVSIANQLGLSKTLTIQLPAQSAKGTYPVTITVDKVNGQANTATAKSTSATLNVYNTLPKHRAVLEEYTGTWCGYCPRGLVALEVMSKRHPDDFIGISYHNSDPMDISTIYDANHKVIDYTFPSDITGFPAGWLDRTYKADAYSGFGSSGFGIEAAWQSICKVFAPVDVAVEGLMNDDNTELTVNATITAPLNTPGDYKVEFVVLGNDLHEAEDFGATGQWYQSNYYSGRSMGGPETFAEPEFATFYDGSSSVYDYHFNDVIIATSRTRGTDAALPSTLMEDEPNTVSTTFDVSTIVNSNGESLIQDINKLTVVALVIDNASGAILNANKAQITGKNIDGIAGVEAAKDNTITEIYDLSGRRIQSLQQGVNIVRTADGRTVKLLKK